MKSWAQGEVCVCELFMNATLPRLVVGRAGGGLSVALGLLAAGRGRRGASRTAREREISRGVVGGHGLFAMGGGG
jgi:hypothetical protein